MSECNSWRIALVRVTLSSAFRAECRTRLPGPGCTANVALGASLKYANTLGVVHSVPFAHARRNVYDHGEIKSTAKILPLIRMWLLRLLPLLLHLPIL